MITKEKNSLHSVKKIKCLISFLLEIGQGDLHLASRKTVGSERGAEQLIECLEVSKEYQFALDEFEETGRRGQEPVKPYLMLAYQAQDVDEFLVEVIKRIRSR